MIPPPPICLFFFFNDPATPEIYPLPLPAALPIYRNTKTAANPPATTGRTARSRNTDAISRAPAHMAADTSMAQAASGIYRHDPDRACIFHRSEEHTSELQSHLNLVCRLLLAKKKT